MSFIPPSIGGGDLILVEAQEIAGGPVDQFDFLLLDGDADGVYELWYWLEARDVDAVKIFLRPNASTGNQACTWTETIGVPANPNSLNEDNRLVVADGLQRPQGWGHIQLSAKTGTFRSFVSTAGEGFGVDAANYSRWRSQGMWRDSVTNITSLRLITTTAGDVAEPGWGNGSRAQLWKRPY